MAVAHSIMKRVLPGYVWRKPNGEILLHKGVLTDITRNFEWIDTDSRIQPRIYLVGDTYCYLCLRCPCTVYEQELQMMRQHEIDKGWMPKPARCPFCSGPIERPKLGDKFVLQYRFAKDGMTGTWWAERREW